MQSSLRFGRFEVRPSEHRVLVDGTPAELRPRTVDLLLVLLEHRDRLVTKEELFARVWPGLVVVDNNLHVHVSALRKLLGPQSIATVPGRGYRFAAVAGSEQSAPVEQDAVCRGNVPRLLPPLVGREEDLRLLAVQVADHRLVTIVGTGGIGKTRLAQSLASRIPAHFADGAWMVELASLADPALVPGAVAQALAERLPGRRPPADEVAELLRSRRLLLVLDNCEHLLAGVCPVVQALVRDAPGVHVLATSQERLKLAAEHLYLLEPLALPASATVATAGESPAVQLFMQRTCALDPAFRLDDKTVGDVVEICHRLDGLPLAIELAAARVRFLGASGVRDRLAHRFQVLADGAHEGLPRHRTLRETLDWSHSLLAESERIAFRRLGVFSGSFSIDAAEQMLADAQFDAWAALNQLGALVDKSLVVPAGGEPPRFRLLESPRAYALEKLARAAETDEVRTRHARAMLCRFQHLDDAEWVRPTNDRLAAALPDLDNLRAALDWAGTDTASAALHVSLTAASAWLWHPAGLQGEGLRRLQLARERLDGATPPSVEARLHTAGVLAAMPLPGEPERAGAERAIGLYRQLGDAPGLYKALGAYARLAAVARDFGACRHALAELETLHDPGWPGCSRAAILTARGYLDYFSGQPDAALASYGALLELAKEFGDAWMERTVLIFMEQAAQALGHYEDAVRLGRELIERHEQLPFRGSLTMACANLCQALTETGRLDEALAAGRQALMEGAEDGMLWITLEVFAQLAARRGRLREAAWALGCSDAAMARRSVLRQPNEQRAYDAALRSLKAALPREADRLLAYGGSLSVPKAASMALGD